MKKTNLWLATILTLTLNIACAPQSSTDLQDSAVASSDPTQTENEPIYDADFVMHPLSWESLKAPFRRDWSLFLQEIILNEWSSLLDGASDMTTFCPRYYELNREQRANVWAGLFSAVSKYESSYDPTSRMRETTMGTDPVTGEQVVSEGLLQLSYQDMGSAKWCAFDWEADKKLAADDPRKTILDPYRNLHCGVGIMARQIAKQNKISVSKGLYWAVLREGGSRTKVPQIAQLVQQISFCTKAE